MNHPDQTRISLILRVANQQDIEAWRQFAEIYQPLVYRIALAKGLQRACAEDLVQEVMSRVAKSVGSWDPDRGKGTFRGWISTIARNLVIDFLRKQGRIPRTSDQSDIRRVVETTAAKNETEYFDRQLQRQLFITAAKQVRKNVCENTWKAFWETAVENQSVDDVAAKLNMTPGAIYVARSRVTAKLKSKVESIGNSELHDV